MAFFNDLKPASRKFIERYPFPDLGIPVIQKLSKSLSECRIVLITTAGLHLKTDKPFSKKFEDSDCSFRIIPSHASSQILNITHTSGDFDQSGIRKDLNVVFPINRIEDLVSAGELGSIAFSHFSFMGSLPRTGELRRFTAPSVANMAKNDNVDLALLTPV